MKSVLQLALLTVALTGAPTRDAGSNAVNLAYTSLWSDNDDSQLAKQLSELHLNEQLSPSVLICLRRLGVGPQAQAALQRLVQKSQPLRPPSQPLFAIEPIPAGQERKDILDRVREYARTYVQNLPNFLCQRVTQR